ncbi:glycerate kinase [Geminisphaera colitermitum]|uniref:glycerate kinase n=1 Tax=Geminisphaera colitermitum TaxID=1148786 RepID=UPI0001964F64|nr:glycerate kinase [Geminisphaera colitermitum]
MNVLVALDKFKDSLSAHQACEIVAEELRRLHPEWVIVSCPLADGGDGFARILTEAAGGQLTDVEACGPRGTRVMASVGVVEMDAVAANARERLAGDWEKKPAPREEAMVAGGTPAPRRLAVVEMAAASGLMLLKPEERDVWRAHTRGTGELLAWARDDAGVDGVVLGLGGSATHDLGLGALAALGVEFCDAGGTILEDLSPANWGRVAEVRRGAASVSGRPLLPPVCMACDVANPLLGQDGAAAVYARQKGLRDEDFARLEAETERMGRMLCACFGYDFDRVARTPGCGAAGGIAFGLMVACGAWLTAGFDLVSDWLRLPEHLAAADLVITGEGRFDRSSLSGKGPGALVREAVARGKAVRVFAGRVELESPATGVTLHEISPRDVPLADALREGADYLRAAVRAAFDGV